MSHRHGYARKCPDTPSHPLCSAYNRGYLVGRTRPDRNAELLEELRALRAYVAWLETDRDKIEKHRQRLLGEST